MLTRIEFQCSSASRKFLNLISSAWLRALRYVSVLFSEPKIPQWGRYPRARQQQRRFQCSSASRKFLNSPSATTISRAGRGAFQCSSASRKFLNHLGYKGYWCAESVSVLFSEPKIPQWFDPQVLCELLRRFQCSSASRKFLNPPKSSCWFCPYRCFSALQRAENSSILHAPLFDVLQSRFSALQRAENSSIFALNNFNPRRNCFSALQRAENSSIENRRGSGGRVLRFQCSSASRKFLNVLAPRPATSICTCFSALQRAENSSMPLDALFALPRVVRFSALQRAENSSIVAT